MILSVCLMAGLAVVGCKKDDGKDSKDGGKDNTPEQPAEPVNLWAEAEEAGAIVFFQYYANYAWSPYEGYDNAEGAEFQNVAVENGVYTVTYEGGSPSRWQSQFYMRPDPAKHPIALEAGKNYEVTFTLESNFDINAFAKFCAYGADGPKHEGAAFKEWGAANDCKGIALKANTPVTIKEVVAGAAVDNINFTFDFGTHGANTVIKVSAISIKETEDEIGGEGAPEPFALVVNGDTGDWGGVAEQVSGASSRIRAWKVTSDAENVYFYFAIRKNRADSGRKLVIGFNTDKDATTGALTDNNNMKGCEAIVSGILPFTNASGAAELVMLTGAGSGDATSTAGDKAENAAFCWGLDMGEAMSADASNVYLEVSIRKAALALPAGEIEVGASYDYYFTNYATVTL